MQNNPDKEHKNIENGMGFVIEWLVEYIWTGVVQLEEKNFELVYSRQITKLGTLEGPNFLHIVLSELKVVEISVLSNMFDGIASRDDEDILLKEPS